MNDIVLAQQNLIIDSDKTAAFLQHVGTNYERFYEAIRSSGKGERTIKQYERTLDAMLREHGAVNLFDAKAVKAAVSDWSNVRRSYLVSIIKLVKKSLEHELNSVATGNNVAHIDASMRRIDAVLASIKVEPQKGEKGHTWLSAEAFVRLCRQVEGESARAKRDLLLLLLLGDCGLRRAEAAALKFSDVLKQGEGYALQVMGKGDKPRVVPMAGHVKQLIDELQNECGGRHVLKSFDRHGNVNDGLTGNSIARIVNYYGACAGHKRLMPHDLRRTFAMIRWRAGVPVAQIGKLLGHASIATTERYLNVGTAELVGREFIEL